MEEETETVHCSTEDPVVGLETLVNSPEAIEPELETSAQKELEKILEYYKKAKDLSPDERLALLKPQDLDLDALKKESALVEYLLENKAKLLAFLSEAQGKKKGKVRTQATLQIENLSVGTQPSNTQTCLTSFLRQPKM